jgi:hypothetical protein
MSKSTTKSGNHHAKQVVAFPAAFMLERVRVPFGSSRRLSIDIQPSRSPGPLGSCTSMVARSTPSRVSQGKLITEACESDELLYVLAAPKTTAMMPPL